MLLRHLVFAALVVCALPASLSAQSAASFLGTVTDESSAVLPGVTVTATEVSSGRQYVGVTDAQGSYRMPSVLPGTYRLQAELSGFATVVIPQVELLVGQSATMPFTLKVATLQETLTVTAESPLVNTQAATVSGNIDRRQMQDLPVLGRNWLDLSLQVKGITANTMAGQRAGVQRDDQFQLNLDGQQVTQSISLSDSFGQPAVSREAISEYVLNLSGYDVTQGRSVGIQVQAISRAGTNNVNGGIFGNFRDDAFNAKDFIANRVLPYSNTQVGGSLGGPIKLNTLHYFGVYEYEREPNTIVMSPSAYAGAAVSTYAFPTNTTQHNVLGRVDYQLASNDHLNVRGTYWDSKSPATQLAAGTYPTSATLSTRLNVSVIGNWSRVITSNLLQEIKVGYTRYEFANAPGDGVPLGPAYQMPTGFPGIGASRSFPQDFFQQTPSARYDLTWHRGSHDVKLGGEFLGRRDGAFWPNQARGVFTIDGTLRAANGVLTNAEFARRFPLDAWNDASKWDLADLRVSRYQVNTADDFNVDLPRKTWALWAADTWAANERLTLNYGVRWDVDWGALDPPGSHDYPVIINNGFDPAGFNGGYITGIRDLGNVGPRGGATFKVTEDLVIRGGAGLFYNFQESNLLTGPQQQINNVRNVVAADYTNTSNNPNFIFDPTAGSAGTTPPLALRVIAPEFKNPRTLQATLGFQQQLGEVFGFDADLLYNKGTNLGLDRDVNLFYDPVSGYPVHPTFDPDGAAGPLRSRGRPRPDYGSIRYFDSPLESESLALATSVTRRLRDRWQMSGSYTLTLFNDDMGSTGFGYIATVSNPFCGTCELGTSGVFQRHTIRLNGIYEAPWGISLSGIYSFGSGQATQLTYRAGATPIGTGTTVGSFVSNRLVTGPAFSLPQTVTFPDGSVYDVRDMIAGGTPTSFTTGQELPRGALQGPMFSKFDMRASKRFSIPGTSLRVTGMVEVFNVFNTANWTGLGTTANLTDGTFARPTGALAPRTGQLAFRVDF